MIISRQHGFLFIHIYKNAGSSIKKALRPYTIPGWQATANNVIKRMGLKQLSFSPFTDHVTASDVIGKIGLERYRSCFSFAIVRNPWDWEVSLYKYVLKNTSHFNHDRVTRMSGFEEYLNWRSRGRVRTQHSFIDYKGKQVVDFVGRFETLNDDWNAICDRIALQVSLPLRNVTASQPYQEFYNPRTIEVVKRMFRADIERFGYTYEGNPVSPRRCA